MTNEVLQTIKSRRTVRAYRPDAVPERTAYYAAQLRAYAGAMARITGRPVCRRTLYFLHCGCSADVPETDA